jgi:DNA-binding NtrC family response regulator
MADKSILVVDDERTIRLLLSRVLKAEGITVLTADSVPAAELLMEHAEVEMIVCDHQMPGEKGLDFLKRLKKEQPRLIRVLLTGHADLSVALDAINGAQVNHLLTKPFEIDELRTTLFDLLDWSGPHRKAPHRTFATQRITLVNQLQRMGFGIESVPLASPKDSLDEDLDAYVKPPSSWHGPACSLQADVFDEVDAQTKLSDDDELFLDEDFLKLIEC